MRLLTAPAMLPPPPCATFFQVDDTYSQLRWSWTEQLMLDEIVDVSHLGTSITVGYWSGSTAAASADAAMQHKQTLTLLCRTPHDAARWAAALRGLQRLDEVGYMLDSRQRARLKRAFREVTSSPTMPLQQQLAFFACLNCELTESQLLAYAATIPQKPRWPQHATWVDLMQLLDVIVRHPRAVKIWNDWRLGVAEGVALRELKEFWAEWQAPAPPMAAGTAAAGADTTALAMASAPAAATARGSAGGVAVGGATLQGAGALAPPTAHIEVEQLLEANRLRHEARLSVTDMQRLLLCDGNAALDVGACAAPHDMTRPLTDYYINSSHNTYLTGHQARCPLRHGSSPSPASATCTCSQQGQQPAPP